MFHSLRFTTTKKSKQWNRFINETDLKSKSGQQSTNQQTLIKNKASKFLEHHEIKHKAKVTWNASTSSLPRNKYLMDLLVNNYEWQRTEFPPSLHWRNETDMIGSQKCEGHNLENWKVSGWLPWYRKNVSYLSNVQSRSNPMMS